MSVGLAFLQKIIEEKGPIAFLSSFNLNRQDFSQEEWEVSQYIEKFASKFGKIPSRIVVEKNINIDFPKVVSEPVEFWVDELKQRTRKKHIRKSLPQIADSLRDGNTDDAVSIIQQLSDVLYRSDDSKSEVLDGYLGGKAILAQHDEIQRLGGAEYYNVPFGFPSLDNVTGGMQKGDVTAIMGFEKSGKTYTLIKTLDAAHNASKRVLVVSMEMSALQIYGRWYGLRTRMSETRIRRGMLNTFDGRKKLKKSIKAIKKEAPVWVIDGAFIYEVEDLQLHIRNYQPDVVLIDGAYLMRTRTRNSGRYDNIANVAEQIKVVSNVTSVPITATWQMGPDLRVFGSRTVEQLATNNIMLFDDTDENAKTAWGLEMFKIMRVKSSRTGAFGAIRLLFNLFHTNIEEVGVLSASEESAFNNGKKKRKKKEIETDGEYDDKF